MAANVPKAPPGARDRAFDSIDVQGSTINCEHTPDDLDNQPRRLSGYTLNGEIMVVATLYEAAP